MSTGGLTEPEWSPRRSKFPYSVSLVHEVLRGVEVERELVEAGVLDVVPGLEVRDVEGVADAGDVRAEERVRRAEEGQDPVLDLTAYLWKRTV